MQNNDLNSDDISKVAKVFSSPIGKEAIEVLDQIFYYPLSYDPNAITMAFNEGHRDVMKFIHNCIQSRGE